MSRRELLSLRLGSRLRPQASRWSVRNQWQRLSLLSPISHCLCRHFTTPTMPSTLRPPLSPLTSPPLPSVAAYRSPVHFIPPAYQSPTASAAPFTFVLLYRYPPHYEAEDNPHYTNKPLQFLLKLAQPSSQHASGLAVYEVVLFGDLSVAELEGVLVSNMHWLASVQIAVKGKVVPQSAAIQSLYAKSQISLVLHPHHSSAYSVAVNGGLPLSRGILSYFSRHRIVYLSALILVLTLLMQATEERPTRGHIDGSDSSGAENGEAQQHWKAMVKEADDKIRDSLFTKADDPEKK